MDYRNCLTALARAAGRALNDDEVRSIYERVHKAALDIKAGRAMPGDVGLGKSKLGKELSAAGGETIFQQAAARAAAELEREAALIERQAQLQVLKIHARTLDADAANKAGYKPLDAVEKTIVRDYSGRVNLQSMEQLVTGHKAYFGAKLMQTWEALGKDFLGFFQDRQKLLNLIRELRGEDSGDALAKAGAKAFHDTAEEARQTFNAAGGDISRLDDWGMPQHHSQEKVAAAGKNAWIDAILPRLDRARYVDDAGVRWTDTQMRDFLGHAWDTIATNGHANVEPGEYAGLGKRANRHAEHRQIHFKDAESVIAYWNDFGERTAFEILHNHIDTMARDIGFIEHFGPNPNLTYQTLREAAVKQAAVAEPRKTKALEGRAVGLDRLFDYVSGKTVPSYRPTFSKTMDGIAHLNTASKLGGAMLASLFGDKPMMEAVSHLNDLPMMQRWRTEMALLNPANANDRAMLQRQGLMLDSVRSGLQRFYEGLGESSTTGKLANAVMRITGMQAINDVRKGAFGLSLMSAIGEQIKAGADFAGLADSDVRTLRNYGITESDWKTWKLAQLQDVGHGNTHTLTPETISRIPDADLKAAGFGDAQAARRDAIVKLLGAVNTESEFAIVTPGWKERSQFYAGVASQRGTVPGEVWRSVLQFKSFPWAMFQRGMDAVANSDGPTSKAIMSSYLIVATTLAGAMLMQTREMLAGKDPRAMADDNWYKFWGQAFLQGGALGIYGDFLYGINQTRYGSGPVEMAAGPTLGPLLELGVVQPLTAIKDRVQGKQTHLAAQTLQDLKGFVPGGNIWYTKAALDHLIWQRAMEALSPGYLATIRSRTLQDYRQQWYWQPGEVTPDRGPDLWRAIGR